MKRVLLPLLLLCISFFAHGQSEFNINNVDGTTLNICGGFLFDSGGQFGNYGTNENFIVTLCPDGMSGPVVFLDFVSFNVVDNDQLCVYDGTSTADPIMGCFNNNFPNPNGGISATPTNASGCLTVQFFTDGVGVANGFQIGISCDVPCQQVMANLDATTPAAVPVDTGYIDICPGETVFFSGSGSYPENNIYYNQSDLTTSFFWNFGDNVNNQGVGLNTGHTYDEPGGYIVQMLLTDVEGCTNSNLISQRIRVSPPVTFTNTSSSATTICVGDTITLTSMAVTSSESFLPASIRSDSLFIPDGTGAAYEAPITFETFNPGQTLTDINDLLGICVNMEHSWMHDIEIEIECPSGNIVQLQNQQFFGEIFLGIPNENDAAPNTSPVTNPPGAGFDYCWTPNATNGTWTQWDQANGAGTLPAGDYNSFEALTGLLGCPLNGDWILRVRDNWGIDNGWIFSWEINFDPNLFPNLETFTPAITSEGWVSDPTILSVNGNTITASPSCPGSATYTYQATNEFGCMYDTTVSVTVLPAGDAACFTCTDIQIDNLPDTTICAGETVSLNPGVVGNDGTILFCNPASQAIPDNSVAGMNPLAAEINITGIPITSVTDGTIQSVCFDAAHGFAGDLDVFLQAPNGSILSLAEDNGGSGDNYTGTCFVTDPSATSINGQAAPFTGDWAPEGDWTTLNGSPVNGTWTLLVFDDGAGFVGTFLGWSITFTDPFTVSYAWDPPAGLSCTNCPDPDATPLATTTYFVTATDNNGCTGTSSVTLTVSTPDPSPIVSCGASTNTSVEFNWSGTDTYEVSLDNGMTWISPNNGNLSHIITGLTLGTTVDILVRPTGGCAVAPSMGSCSTNNCPPITATPSTTDVSCNGGMDGSLSILVNGGTLPYTYDWTGGIGNTDAAVGLPADVYDVTVTDNLGCVIIENFITIGTPSEIMATVTSSDPLCNGDSNGSLNLSVSGGTPDYTYSWDAAAGNQTTNPATGLAAGTYVVTITDNSACEATASGTLSEPTLLSVTGDQTDVTCNAGSDASASAIPAGGTEPYTYLWSVGAQTDSTATGLSSAGATVTVTDANACEATLDFTINEPTALVLNGSITPASCNGGLDGSASVVASGSTPPYTYQWGANASGQTTQTATGLGAGLYTVVVRDSNQCILNLDITVTENSAITYTMAGSLLDCFGDADGTASVTVTSGSAPFTFAWDDLMNQTTATATGLFAGTYTVTITDGTGCSAIDQAVVTQPALFTNTIVSPNLLCNGDMNGFASVASSGGTPDYTYLWDDPNGQTDASATGLGAGTYTVTITDTNACSITAGTTINEPPLLSLALTGTDINCNAGNDGTASATANGGTPDYTYLWDDANGQTTDQATGLIAGTYTVTVTDNNACSVIETISLTEPTAIALSGSSTEAACNGGTDGTATVVAMDGTPGYTYQWDTNAADQTTDVATGLSSGTYIVTVTDANACEATISVPVSENASFTFTSMGSDLNCFGDMDGTTSVTVNGGTLPYTYLWDDTNNQTTSQATGLTAGSYTVSITDGTGCQDFGTVMVTEPTELTAAATSTDASCNGGNDGTVTAIPAGGTPGYTFLWNDTNNQTTAIATGLTAGVYSVTVSDDNGCAVTTDATINEPTLLTVLLSGTDILCNTGNDGSASATASGGTPDYTYLWSDLNNQTTSQATGLTAGNYTVTVTDNNMCSLTETITLTEPTAVTLSGSSTEAACSGGTDGTATVIAMDGTPGYTYLWDTNANNQTTDVATGLAAGAYIVTVTDANACESTLSVPVAENAAFTFASTGSTLDCFGDMDGTASVAVNGGTPPYTYLWNDANGQTTDVATGLIAGTYSVSIFDGTGCQGVDNADVLQPSELTAAVNPSDVSCNGGNDGQATAIPAGGTPDYTFSWDDPNTQTTAIATGLVFGNYTVTVTDNNGCSITSSTTINEPTLLAVTLAGTDINCNGGLDGTATATPAGGTPDYTYQWDDINAQTNNLATGLAAGTFSVTVTDNNSCTVVETITLTEPTAIALSSTSSPAACNGGSDGTATVIAIDGTPGYTYLWDTNAADQTTDVATGLTAGSYVVTVSDANACEATISVPVSENPSFTLTSMGSALNCFGDMDGTASVTPSGGTPPFTYLWNDTNSQTTDVATGLTAGTYTVSISDGTGCEATENVIVTQPTELTAAASQTDVTCNTGNDGTATVIPAGGTPVYTYLWDDTNAQTTDVATGLTAGTYTVTVSDNNACTITATTTVNEPVLLSLMTTGTNINCADGTDGTATASPTGGTIPYTFEWSDTDSQTSATATGLEEGTYIVTVTDNNACTITGSVTLTEPTSLALSLFNDQLISCFGGNDGAASVVPNQATPPYTYQWNDPENQTTNSVTGLTAGQYIVTVTDNNGCSSFGTVVLTEPTALEIVGISSTPTSCDGDADGTSFVLASGGTPNIVGGTPVYTYQWNDVNNQTTQSATGLTAGNYTVVVTDANACSTISTVDVLSPSPLTLAATGTDVLCNGGNSGTALAAPAGGNGQYTFLWDDADTQTTASATGLVAGTYTVSVNDQNGCDNTASVVINEPTAITLDSSFTAVNCFGGSDGTATITAMGGTPDYTYSWDATAGNQNTATATGLSAGNYLVTVSDNNACTETASVTITEPLSALSTQTSASLVSCFGGNDGSGSVVASGGTGAYTYLWDAATNSQTDATATGLIAGVYTVTVSDNNGCISTNITTVNEPAELLVALSSTPESCFGADGTATVIAGGGTGAYTYLWDPSNQTDATATGLAEGTYIVSVTDENSCTTTGTVDVAGPNPITLDSAFTAVTCFGGSDGTATGFASGGAGGFTFEWSAGGQMTQTATGLSAGTYSFTATDVLGCSEIATVTVTEPTELIASTTSTEVSCFAGTDGSSTVSATGGTGAYTYLWDAAANNQTTNIAFNLAAGTYNVTVFDNNGCEAVSSAIITQPATALTASLTGVDLLCNGGDTGSATALPNGGTPGYTFEWNDVTSQTSASATGLTAGTYTVTITDDNGCRIEESITLNEPAPITIIVTETPSTCFAGDDGTATAVGSGGTISTAYLFNWSNGQVGATATGLMGGTSYTVSVTDDNGCQETADIFINQPDPITLGTMVTDVSCFSGDDGQATVFPNGGTPPYSYLWDAAANNQITDTAIGLNAGSYDVTVLDANACSATTSVTLTQPTVLDIQLIGSDLLCKGDSTGTASVSVQGGTPDYTYLWNNPDSSTTANATDLRAGIYTVTVTDQNGCSATGTTEVTEPAEFLGTDATPIDASCFGRSDGRIEVFGSGGTPPYQYSVDGQNYNGSNLIIGLASNLYTVYTRDANGCVDTSSVFIQEPPELFVSLGPDQTIEFGDSIQLEAITNMPGVNYTYEWSSFSPRMRLSCRDCANPVARPLDDLTYTVRVTNEAGCTAEASIRIRVIKVDRVFIANTFTPNGDGNNDFFFVQGGEGIRNVYEVRVFDRWGELVYKRNNLDLNNASQGWDGTFRDEPMNPGVFTYVAIVEFDDRTQKTYTGTITLIR